MVTEESWSQKFMCPHWAHIHDCISPTTPSGSHLLLSSHFTSSCQAWGRKRARSAGSTCPAGPLWEEQPVWQGRKRPGGEPEGGSRSSPGVGSHGAGQEEKAPFGIRSGQVPQGGCVCPAQLLPWLTAGTQQVWACYLSELPIF